MTTSVIKNSDLEGAFACVKAMKQAGVVPNVVTYNALISACEKAGNGERALEVFDDMRAAGIVPDVITYGGLISACKKAGKGERALEVFEDMQAAGIVPDVITYNALISACEKAGKGERALEVFDDMRAAGIVPDVITYSALISACEKAGKVETALEVFKDMRVAGVVPNVITYSALISTCEGGGRPADARRLLQEAVSDRVFHPSLGYDASTNSLDFHLNRLLVPSLVEAHAGGVSAGVAQVLFDHHLALGHLSSTTEFVVGQRGDDVIKDAIAQRMRTQGWAAVEGISHGKVNPGRLVVAQNPAQTAPFASTLNAAAKEFVPSWLLRR